MADSIAERALMFADNFEAEVLVFLMLDHWKHPHARNKDFQTAILQAAAEALQASVDGQVLLESLRPQDMNFIAAVWYAEWNSLDDSAPVDEHAAREAWLEEVRRSLPSCLL